MKTINLSFLSVLITMVTWSCSDSSSPVSPNEGLAESPYAEAKKVSVQADSLTDFGQQIPGFGGLFINDSDQLSIYLTNPAQQQAKARAVLSNSELIAKALSNSSASVSEIKVLKGQYTFIELHNWEKEVSSKVLAIDDAYRSSIDQSRNKLSVGVKDKAVIAKVKEKLSELNIPRDAVLMYQMTPPQTY